MRKDLKLRLARVNRRLALVHRLRKIALSNEGELIDRMSERSKKVLLDVRGKLFRAVKQIEPALEEAGRASLSKVLEDLSKVVTNVGVVNTSAVQEMKADLEQTWKAVSRATKGNTSVMHLFNSVDKFVTVALLGSLLQNSRMVERAKVDEKTRDKLYSVMEQMAQVIPQVQAGLQKAVKSLPAAEAPAAAEPPAAQDSTPTEVVTTQLAEAESEMRGIVSQLSRVLVKKAEEMFGIGSEMADAIDENIFAIYNKRQVNPQLNRDRGFYEDALHLEHSPTPIDLGEFLDTKPKKAIYLCYRSFVMAARALGVVQAAKQKPDLVIKSQKLQELVVKAQKILVKRKDTIVAYLQALKKSEKEEEKESEKGIPKGTFTDFFEQQDKSKSRAKGVPKRTFSDA